MPTPASAAICSREASPLPSTVRPAAVMRSMLERASTLHRDSSGAITARARVQVVARELAGSTAAAPRFAEVVTGWAFPLVKREQGQAIEPEDRDDALQLVARVSRRMRLLTPGAQRTLALLYGDHGCRWQRQKVGRLWALVPDQAPARRALARDDQERAAKGRPAAELQPAERLAMLASVQPRPVWAGAALENALFRAFSNSPSRGEYVTLLPRLQRIWSVGKAA